MLKYRDALELPGPSKKGSITANDPYRGFMLKLIDSNEGTLISKEDISKYFANYNESMKSNKSSKLVAKAALSWWRFNIMSK